MSSRRLIFEGKTFVLGDNINTDLIIPGRYLTTDDPEKLAPHALEDISPEYPRFKPDKFTFIVCGRNFGCGSSREQAPVALDAAGVKVIIANSFARIYFRNAVNTGKTLPVEVEEEVWKETETNDNLFLDIERKILKNTTKNKIYRIKPFQEEISQIITAGGLSAFVKKEFLKNL